MFGTDTGDVLCGIDVVKVVSVRQKTLLTGTCWYELTELWHLLSAQGHRVYCVPPGYSCVREGGLIIVALSAEPVTGWGRHLSWIREPVLSTSEKNAPVKKKNVTAGSRLRSVWPNGWGRYRNG